MIRYADGSIQVIGHTDTLKAVLRVPLGNVLLEGPSSVGKRSILEKVIEVHGVTDVVRVFDMQEVDFDTLRQATTESTTGKRVILLRLGVLRKDSAERLLKIIEDAAPQITFLATSVFRQQPAIRTRFTTYTVGALSDDEVALILLKLGFSSQASVALAEKGYGSIDKTVQASKNSPYMSLARKALKCIEEHDEDALDALYSRWEDGHTYAILDWAREAITEKWRTFKPTDFPELGKSTAIRILYKVDSYDRPRYVVRASLASIIREDQG